MTLRIIHVTKASDVELQPRGQLVVWNFRFLRRSRSTGCFSSLRRSDAGPDPDAASVH